MPSTCSAYGCFNSSDKASCIEKKISFHRFPINDRKRLRLWLNTMKRKKQILATNDRICSEHFYNSDFRYLHATKRRVLNRSAVPTKFYSTINEAQTSPRTSYEFESSIDQDDISETEISSKEKSTPTSDISTNHLLMEIEIVNLDKKVLTPTNDISTNHLLTEIERLNAEKDVSIQTNDISTNHLSQGIENQELGKEESTQNNNVSTSYLLTEIEILNLNKKVLTSTNDISTNHLLTEIERLNAEKEVSIQTNDISTNHLSQGIENQELGKEESTQNNNISTNHLLAEIEKLKAENAQLKTDLKKISEYVFQLLEKL